MGTHIDAVLQPRRLLVIRAAQQLRMVPVVPPVVLPPRGRGRADALTPLGQAGEQEEQQREGTAKAEQLAWCQGGWWFWDGAGCWRAPSSSHRPCACARVKGGSFRTCVR